MAHDNDEFRKKHHRDQIDVDAEIELLGWSAHFGTTPARIRAAVSAVGPRVHDVAKWLSQSDSRKAM